MPELGDGNVVVYKLALAAAAAVESFKRPYWFNRSAYLSRAWMGEIPDEATAAVALSSKPAV